MRYAYSDLGEQAEGATVVVTVRGGATNVLLLSMAEFVRYSADQSFEYHGGGRRTNPMRIRVPRDDHWFAVLEIGSYNARVRATVEVLPPGEEGEPQPAGALVDADRA